MTATVPTVAEPTHRSNRPPPRRALIRVAVLDDHAAVRAGLEAIRNVAGAANRPPAVPLSAQRRAAARLDPADHPVLAMRLAGNSWAEIAATLRQPVGVVADRAAAIVIRLTEANTPGVSSAAAKTRARRRANAVGRAADGTTCDVAARPRPKRTAALTR